MQAAIKLNNIKKSFGDTEVIKGVDFSIEPGEFVALVGPSGCGKSTLLRMIAGLESISSGELYFDDDLVNSWKPAKRKVGMVFQSYALYPHMTVEENVGFGLKLSKVGKKERQERVDAALDILQLDALKKRKPAQLSGGQRQRVAIGRAIVRRPNVFLFDEPLSNLDTELRVQMRMEIGRLHRKLKNTVIYVTHDQVEAMTLADRIVVLEGGVVRQIGKPLDLYERPNNRFVAGFMGTPKMAFINIKPLEQIESGFSISMANGEGGESTVTLVERQGHADNLKAVTMGIRPEDCWLESGEKAVLHGEVLELERLGAETFAFLDIPGTADPIAVRLKDPNNVIQPGERAGLNFNTNRVHLFDANGDAIHSNSE